MRRQRRPPLPVLSALGLLAEAAVSSPPACWSCAAAGADAGAPGALALVQHRARSLQQARPPRLRSLSRLFPASSGRDGRGALLQGTSTAGDVPPECFVEHEEDKTVPLRRLQSEHPGEDLTCRFGFLGDWCFRCAEAHLAENFMIYSQKVGYEMFIDLNGTVQKIAYDGGTFYSRNHLYTYDDIYCHANGWLKGQGLPVEQVTNYTAWTELARQECAKLSGLFPNASPTVQDMMDRDDVDRSHLKLTVRDGDASEAPATRELQYHALTKCGMDLLGCDMAYCSAWCLRADGLVGHTPEECGGPGP